MKEKREGKETKMGKPGEKVACCEGVWRDGEILHSASCPLGCAFKQMKKEGTKREQLERELKRRREQSTVVTKPYPKVDK
jgi:hypothetical protein